MIEQMFPSGMAHYLGGGLLMGVAVSLAFVTSGLVTGMSMVFSSTWSYVSNRAFFQQRRFVASRGWRLVLAAGLILGGLVYVVIIGGGTAFRTEVSWWQLALGGSIGGYGARMANGCTSGHGICGLASLQVPSLLAVLTFLITAMVTANLVKLIGGV